MPLALIWVRSQHRPLAAHPHWSRQNLLQAADFQPTTGTTYSCVATYEGSNVEIIANEQGSFTTPSFVSFTAEERLIGEAAKNQAAMNPVNTVFDVKYAPFLFFFSLPSRYPRRWTSHVLTCHRNQAIDRPSLR